MIVKYSLPNRIKKGYLKQADEIKVQASDIGKTIEYIEEFPTATIVQEINRENTDIEGLDFKQLEMLNEKAEGRFICELEDISLYNHFQERNIPYFWKFPATSFYELQGLKEIGVCQVLIDAPLFFLMKRVKNFGIPVRVIPNVAYDSYIPRENGIHGTWIRPQDTDLYEEYVDTFEFRAEKLVQQEALFDIYAKEKEWFNPMNLLIKNFNYPIMGSAIPDDIIENRLSCGQCCSEGRCHLCDSAIKFGKTLQDEII